MKDLTQLQVMQKCLAELPGYSSVEQTLNSLNVKHSHTQGSGKRIYNEVFGWSKHHPTYREALAEMLEKQAEHKLKEDKKEAGSVQ